MASLAQCTTPWNCPNSSPQNCQCDSRAPARLNTSSSVAVPYALEKLLRPEMAQARLIERRGKFQNGERVTENWPSKTLQLEVCPRRRPPHCLPTASGGNCGTQDVVPNKGNSWRAVSQSCAQQLASNKSKQVLLRASPQTRRPQAQNLQGSGIASFTQAAVPPSGGMACG